MFKDLELGLKILVIGSVLTLIGIILGIVSCQIVNLKFIEKGYSQVQKQGTTDFLWQLK